jgi:hypothetical protein
LFFGFRRRGLDLNANAGWISAPPKTKKQLGEFASLPYKQDTTTWFFRPRCRASNFPA